MMDTSSFSRLIVGAGMAGLTAARRLRAAVIDKERGVGGRMATRRIDQAFNAPHFLIFTHDAINAGDRLRGRLKFLNPPSPDEGVTNGPATPTLSNG